MSKSDLVALAASILFVLAMLAIRFLWLASGTASAAALGRLPLLPKSWRRWLLGERIDTCP
jgi:hypothetical protein